MYIIVLTSQVMMNGVSKSRRLVAEVLHIMLTCLEVNQCVPTSPSSSALGYD